MKRNILLLIAVLLFLGCAAFSENTEPAVNSAKQWLAQVDAGNYDASWDNAAQYFKDAVSPARWAKMLSASRAPLGKVVSRKLKSATYTTTLPGAPDGQYVVVQYDSSFQHKNSAIETVTPMIDKDGQWRVSGYFIK
jgi:hypothetical protein